MSIVTSTAAKLVGKAFALKTDQDLQMFDDLWEVYQIGHHFEKTHEKALDDSVDKSYSAIINIAAKQSGQDAPGFGRSGMSTRDKFVIFSDFHMTDRMNRQDWFFRFNFKLYLEVLKRYSQDGFALIENGDVEDLVIFEPTPGEAKNRRQLVRRPTLGLDDVGEINWDELVGVRIENRRKTLERMLNENKIYYDTIKQEFGKDRYIKVTGNHDGYVNEVLVGMIESEFWPEVLKDVVTIERQSPHGSVVRFVVTHGHQFDRACCPPNAKQVGETISECLAWGYQGADRIWRVSDTQKWSNGGKFNNVLSAIDSQPVVSGHPDLENFLECLLGHQVAWEYFENKDPYMAYVKEVCTGDEFLKVRHTDENKLANHLLALNTLPVVPTVICGHTHEPRDRSTFSNTSALAFSKRHQPVPSALRPPDTNDLNLFTRYMNAGSAGRFENLIWGIEIDGDRAQVISWTNSGTSSHIVPKKVIWKSDDQGSLIGKEA